MRAARRAALAVCGLVSTWPGAAVAQTAAPEQILSPPEYVRRAQTRPSRPDDPLLRPSQDADDAVAPQRPVPPPPDGDLTQEVEPTPLRDGILAETEPQLNPAIDTPEGLGADARAPEDIRAFTSPPAGHDPLLFRIDDIAPLQDRRVGRLFRREPYEPLGIRLGSFVVFPQMELAGVAFSNVLSSPQARSDRALAVITEMRAVSDWRWHGLEVRARGDYTFHDTFDSEDDRRQLIEARGRIDATSRTNLQALASREVSQESRTGVNPATATNRADVTTTNLAASLNHRFNRLSLQLRGGVTEVDVGRVRTPGSSLTNAEKDVRTTEEAVRATYELKPTLSVFGEVATNQRDYHTAPADGIRRDSDGARLRVGLGFGTTGEWLRGEASIGWGRQDYDDRLRSIDGFLFDANLAYRMTPLTTLLLTGRTEFSDSLDPGVTGAVGRTLGLEARHVFRAWLIGSAALTTTRYDFTGSPAEEQTTTASLGLEYYISREIMLFGRYQHQWFDSNAAGADWQADEARLGVRIRH